MAAAEKLRSDELDSQSRARVFKAAIGALTLKAIPLCVKANIDETMQKWLVRCQPPADAADAERLLDEAAALATELALHTPSISGVRPIDRLARLTRALTPDEAAALEYRRAARFTFFRVTAPVRAHVYQASDLSSGRLFLLFEDRFAASALGLDLGARLCPIIDGLSVIAGPTIALEILNRDDYRAFLRSGSALLNDQRCAAQVYHDYLRSARSVGLGVGLEAEEKQVQLSHPHEELDALVSAWAASGQGAAPTDEALAALRDLTSVRGIGAALFSCVELAAAGKQRLADIYRCAASIQMETLHRRSLIGSGENNPLDILRAAFEETTAKGRFPRAALEIFLELKRKIMEAQGAAKPGSEDLKRVIERIRALRAKTTAQGCTEQEALAAAAKVAEMLERYGLSLSEIELRKQACEGFGVDTGRRRRAPADRCVNTIAAFCDSKVWSETGEQGTIRYVFFGLPADVEAAHYLYDLVLVTFDTEAATLRRGALYVNNMNGAARRAAVASFEIGLANGISMKLDKLKAARQAATLKSTGRDLVLVKTSVLDEELERLGLSFQKQRMSRRRKVVVEAFEAGRAAGSQFEVHPGIK